MSMAIFMGLWAVIFGANAVIETSYWRLFDAFLAAVFAAVCAILWHDAMNNEEEGVKSE